MSNTKVACAICGKKLKRLTLNHLRRHKITSKAEYRSFLSGQNKSVATANSNVNNADEAVKRLVQMILTGAEPDEGLLSYLTVNQTNLVKHLTISMDHIRLKRLGRLSKLVNAMDRIDDRLLDPSRIDGLTFHDLLKVAACNSEEIRKLSTDIKTPSVPVDESGVQVSQNTIILNNTNPSLEGNIPEDPRERNRLLKSVSNLLALQNSKDGSFDGEPQNVLDIP